MPGDGKGFDGWVEIFKGGKQVDSVGREHDGDAVIDRAMATFNAAEHEPPAVIGHPALNAPAYGWVNDIKKDVVDGTNRLFAQFHQVVPEFADMVQRGLFKKRSAAFYPDGRLRHVGFLGAMPPAVKGLADMAFDEGQPLVFEFGEEAGVLARVLRRLRDFFIERDGQDTADRIVSDWEINELQDMARRPQPENSLGDIAYGERDQGQPQEVPPMAGDGKQFSEADLKAAEEKAAAKAKAEAQAEFAEQQKKKAVDARLAVVGAYLTKGHDAGGPLPAWKDAGIKEFMEHLAGADGVIEFSEAAGGKKDPLTWFMNFADGIGKMVDFGEIATRGTDVKGGNAGAKLDTLVKAKLAANKDLSYGAAFSEVQAEHPGLAKEYAAELGG